jgi:hypothetical protein
MTQAKTNHGATRVEALPPGKTSALTFTAPEGTLVETGRGLTHGGLTLHDSTPVTIGRIKSTAPRKGRP